MGYLAKWKTPGLNLCSKMIAWIFFNRLNYDIVKFTQPEFHHFMSLFLLRRKVLVKLTCFKHSITENHLQNDDVLFTVEYFKTTDGTNYIKIELIFKHCCMIGSLRWEMPFRNLLIIVQLIQFYVHYRWRMKVNICK